MDIYRFFHPHHNPRLHSTPLRQQELAELEQAASELRKSLERAQKRSLRKPSPPILHEHFTDVIKAARFIENSLQTLCDAHPGDPRTVILELINERSEFPGWDTWASLLREQIASDHGSHSEDEEFREEDDLDLDALPRVGVNGGLSGTHK